MGESQERRWAVMGKTEIASFENREKFLRKNGFEPRFLNVTGNGMFGFFKNRPGAICPGIAELNLESMYSIVDIELIFFCSSRPV
jgi:hypothetical protein